MSPRFIVPLAFLDSALCGGTLRVLSVVSQCHWLAFDTGTTSIEIVQASLGARAGSVSVSHMGKLSRDCLT